MVYLQAVSADDWRLWRDTRLAALRDAPEAFSATLGDWDAADEQRWRRRLEEVPFNVVARRGGEAVGQASGTALDTDGSVELISMWVAPAARGLGVGVTLIEAVSEWGRQTGAVAVRLAVRRSNTPARRLYERTGFVLVDDVAPDPSEVQMVRTLPPD